MKKAIVKPIIFFVILVILVQSAGNLFQPEYYWNVVGGDGAGYEDKYEAFYNERKNSLDVLFLGTSTGMDSFLPIELYKEYGISSYVLSCGMQMMSTSYYLLKSALNYQNPKYVVLDISMLVRGTRTLNIGDINNNYKAIQEIREVDNKYEALYATKTDYFDWSEWFIPLVKFHTRWKELNKNDFQRQYVYDVYPSYFKGSYVSRRTAEWYQKKNASIEVEFDYTNNYRKEYYNDSDQNEKNYIINFYDSGISDQSIYFDKIVSLCEEKGIKLICVKGPTAVSWSEEKHENVDNYLNVYNLELVDMNYGKHKVDIDWRTETADGGLHVNYFGALKSTGHMGDYLLSQGGLKDHRGDKAYQEWDVAVKRYTQDIFDFFATGNERAIRWLENLNGNKSEKIILIAVRDDISYGYNEEYQKQMTALGIQTDLYNNHKNSFLAVVNDGKVVYEKRDDKILIFKDVIYDMLDNKHKLEMKSAGMAQGDSCYIKIDDVNCEVNGQGFNIVVYDKAKGRVTESVSICVYKDGIFIERKE